MTVTEDRPTSSQTQGSTGRVMRVTGPVVDVEFPRDAMPDLFNALKVDVTLADGTSFTLDHGAVTIAAITFLKYGSRAIPPTSPVPPEWGTTGTRASWQARRIVATSSVDPGASRCPVPRNRPRGSVRPCGAMLL